MQSNLPFSSNLQPLAFDQLNGWGNDDHLAALKCFQLSALRMQERPYSTKRLGISAADLAEIGHLALRQTVQNNAQAKLFFEQNFCPHKHNGPKFGGLLTGYFEPELAASTVKTRKFKYPLYRRPDDLIDIDEDNRPDHIDKSFAFARKTNGGIVEYFDRREIHNGVLRDKGLEIVWLEDLIDVYYIHIQGSTRLTLEDNSQIRLSYAAKTGHPYSSIGKILVDRGEMKLEDVTMQKIRDWIGANPKEGNELICENRSFIFFQIINQPHPELGPVAAAGVALTSGRSLAIDHKLHTFGTPFWVETRENFMPDDGNFARLLIAQDTGSAIIGPRRADYFVGSGYDAGQIAGQIKHAASLIVMVPKSMQSD